MCTIMFGSCNSKKSDQVKKDMKVDFSGPEYTSKYICPMYCKGSGSDEMGICLVCKMDYELNEEYQADELEHNHEGHDHGSHDGHQH